MPNKIALITDSTNDLPMELRQKYEITVVPMTILWGDQEYLDGIDLKPVEFYERLAKDPIRPTTSQPTPGDFTKAYIKVRDKGAKEIIVATISSEMSGTNQAARSAAQDFSIPVEIVDSKSNSMGLGWQVLAMARARESGVGISEILKSANVVRNQLHYHIVLDTLEYLVKGGRIAGAAKLLGNVLDIKPQVRVNHQTGSVEAGDISRTRGKAIETLYSGFFKKLDISKPMRIAVLHNNAFEEAQQLADKVKNEFDPVELMIGIVSPILGVHTGPRAIALCGYSEL